MAHRRGNPRTNAGTDQVRCRRRRECRPAEPTGAEGTTDQDGRTGAGQSGSGGGVTRRRVLRSGTVICTAMVGSIGASSGIAAAQEGTVATGEVIWQNDEHHESATGAPVVVDDVVYHLSEAGLMAADARSGEFDWRSLSHTQSRAPAVIGDVAYFPNTDPHGTLRAVRAGPDQESTDVETLWSYERDTEVDGHPAGHVTATDETVYYGYGDGQFHAIDAETGDREWDVDVAPDAIRAPSVVADGRVHFATNVENEDGVSLSGTVYALDAGSGEEVWSVETEFTPFVPTVVDGVVYAVTEYVDDSTRNSTDGFRVFAFDGESGDEVWTKEVPVDDTSTPHPPTVAGGLLYTQYNGRLYAFDVETGDEQWSTVPGDGITGMRMPTVADGTLFTYTSDSEIVAVDAATGDVHWRSAIDDGRRGEGLLVVAGALFLVTSDYGSTPSTYAINAGVEGSSEDSSVRLGTFGHHHAWAGTDPPDEPYAVPTEPPDGSGDDPDGPGDDSDGSADSAAADDDTVVNGDGQPGPGLVGTIGAIGGAGYLFARLLGATGRGDRD